METSMNRGMTDAGAFVVRNSLEAASEILVRLPIAALVLSLGGGLANAWITSSSSASITCAACCRAIFNTIMTPERIFRSARTARDLVPYNLPRSATLWASRKLAVCTIAMSVEPLKAACCGLHPSNCRHVNFEQGQWFIGKALRLSSSRIGFHRLKCPV